MKRKERGIKIQLVCLSLFFFCPDVTFSFLFTSMFSLHLSFPSKRKGDQKFFFLLRGEKSTNREKKVKKGGKKEKLCGRGCKHKKCREGGKKTSWKVLPSLQNDVVKSRNFAEWGKRQGFPTGLLNFKRHKSDKNFRSNV